MTNPFERELWREAQGQQICGRCGREPRNVTDSMNWIVRQPDAPPQDYEELCPECFMELREQAENS